MYLTSDVGLADSKSLGDACDCAILFESFHKLRVDVMGAASGARCSANNFQVTSAERLAYCINV